MVSCQLPTVYFNEFGRVAKLTNAPALGAGYRPEMVKYGDALLVFIKNNSRGSLNMVNCMTRYPGKKCHIVYVI